MAKLLDRILLWLLERQKRKLHSAIKRRDAKAVEKILLAAKAKTWHVPTALATDGGAYVHSDSMLSVGFYNALLQTYWKIPPLHWAARDGNIEIVEIILRVSGTLQEQLREFFRENKESVKVLSPVGPTIHSGDVLHYTPLHIAAIFGHRELCAWLLDNGADISSRADGGVTPLHSAAGKGRRDVVELLVSRGADLQAKADDGKTALDWALDFKHNETAAFLKG